jgi:RpiB/LacA/LacB family sugar-phosphate isomerase
VVSVLLVGSDHAGYELKEFLKGHLTAAGHVVVDKGPTSTASVDYPDFAAAVCHALMAGEGERAVLVCGTGVGMSIVANKVRGVRAALVHDPYTARMAREHNDANVLCLGARLLAPAYAALLVDQWLGAEFETRHQRRLDLISALEAGRSTP